MKLYTNGHLLDTDKATHCFRMKQKGSQYSGDIYRSSRGTWYVHRYNAAQVLEPVAILSTFAELLTEEDRAKIIELSQLEWE